MSDKKIVFRVDGIEKDILVQGCYPYLVNPIQNKVVLKISVNEEDAGFDDLYDLKRNESGVIDYYENVVNTETGGVSDSWEKKNTYEDYNSGEVQISYQNGQYSCDVTRIGKFEKMVEKNQADIEYLSIMADIPLEN